MGEEKKVAVKEPLGYSSTEVVVQTRPALVDPDGVEVSLESVVAEMSHDIKEIKAAIVGK